ncbi:MAG: KH domain-containing protein [Fimbriimonadaceae bacterium]|nr:KH domain-containing protein [Fimbriimonadaceae bacterium]
MAELLDFIVRGLVDEPEAVKIVEVPGRRLTVYEIAVADRDRGKVIGKQGRIANAIRTVAKAAATHGEQHIAVEIVT